MRKIVQGVSRFRREVYPGKRELFRSLSAGQSPLALFITCSDSRIEPHLITQTNPGELFVLRNAGNVVPPYGSIDGGEAATIEYAVKALGVADIIICGHAYCGAMAGLVDPTQLSELPAVSAWVKHAEPAVRRVRQSCCEATEPDELLARTVEANVLVQLEHLKSHPAVAEAVQQRSLELHGWVYQFVTGDVLAYDFQKAVFCPIDAES